MKITVNIIIVFLVIMFVSSVTSAQMRRVDKGFGITANAVMVPDIPNNPGFGTFGAGVGITTFFHFDALEISGDAQYIFSSNLYTASGKLMYELPIRQKVVKYPYLVGVGYRVFLPSDDGWNVNCISVVGKYIASNNIVINIEAGITTRTLKDDPPKAFVMVGMSYVFGWRN